MEADFQLHERLENDTIHVEDWDLSRVLLAKDAKYPWLILVPRRSDLKEVHDLSSPDLAAASAEIVRASRALDDLFKPQKINLAALGNQVPQLHIHVIARFSDDPSWPAPVWGAVPPRPYEATELQQRLRALRDAFSRA
jgi:diadenosine tetraphosphate (Ap4A) HIT family hydrolase